MRRSGPILAAAGILAGVLAGLATCETGLRREQVALCRRALPAVAPEPGAQLLRAGPGAAPDTVRVDYAEGRRQRHILCRFDGGTTLIGLSHDGTPLSGAALHMLRRYYLDTPDAAAADPGAR